MRDLVALTDKLLGYFWPGNVASDFIIKAPPISNGSKQAGLEREFTGLNNSPVNCQHRRLTNSGLQRPGLFRSSVQFEYPP